MSPPTKNDDRGGTEVTATLQPLGQAGNAACPKLPPLWGSTTKTSILPVPSHINHPAAIGPLVPMHLGAPGTCPLSPGWLGQASQQPASPQEPGQDLSPHPEAPFDLSLRIYTAICSRQQPASLLP